MALTVDNLQLGTVYGWNNIQCVMFGSSLVGFESITWNRKQKIEHVFGANREPVGVKTGNVEYTGELEILFDELVKIIDNAPNGLISDIPAFSIYVYINSDINPRKVVLGNVRFLENPFKSSQGEGEIKLTLPLLIGTITYS